MASIKWGGLPFGRGQVGGSAPPAGQWLVFSQGFSSQHDCDNVTGPAWRPTIVLLYTGPSPDPTSPPASMSSPTSGSNVTVNFGALSCSGVTAGGGDWDGYAVSGGGVAMWRQAAGGPLGDVRLRADGANAACVSGGATFAPTGRVAWEARVSDGTTRVTYSYPTGSGTPVPDDMNGGIAVAINSATAGNFANIRAGHDILDDEFQAWSTSATDYALTFSIYVDDGAGLTRASVHERAFSGNAPPLPGWQWNASEFVS